ncbi:MAG: NAD-dependent epimerase/dehydratase family protein [Candidatus Latescibacterota bacterium]|nr:NAD-dependent epimerase/dehydratase family protein [Candidatus Latescibacterota bacterium]
MKSVLLTGINGTVAQMMRKELGTQYDIAGLSIPRMEEVLAQKKWRSWKEQLQAYHERVTVALDEVLPGKVAVVHLGWNTQDENWQGGLDPHNIAVVDWVYRAAIAHEVPRIYMASSVHSYDFMGDDYDKKEPIPPFPDARRNAFGTPPSSLYGVSKRWMEIAGQYYAQRLAKGQKILVVRLGAVGAESHPPKRPFGRLWNSHPDLAGLLAAFIECADDAPDFWITYGVSGNVGEDHHKPMFDTVNPYGFEPRDNAFEHRPG